MQKPPLLRRKPVLKEKQISSFGKDLLFKKRFLKNLCNLVVIKGAKTNSISYFLLLNNQLLHRSIHTLPLK